MTVVRNTGQGGLDCHPDRLMWSAVLESSEIVLSHLFISFQVGDDLVSPR